jgi:hypothetical protein
MIGWSGLHRFPIHTDHLIQVSLYACPLEPPPQGKTQLEQIHSLQGMVGRSGLHRLPPHRDRLIQIGLRTHPLEPGPSGRRTSWTDVPPGRDGQQACRSELVGTTKRCP